MSVKPGMSIALFTYEFVFGDMHASGLLSAQRFFMRGSSILLIPCSAAIAQVGSSGYRLSKTTGSDVLGRLASMVRMSFLEADASLGLL
jgi:hypothetical protein